MPPQFLVDLSKFDLNRIEIPIEEVRKENAQRFEMEQLDGLIRFDRELGFSIGVKQVRHDEFWVRGHIPGRPLMPGVVIVESAAQLCTYHYRRAVEMEPDKFLGFAQLDKVKFRGTVVPGDRLITIAKVVDLWPRRALFDAQAVVGDRLVFEGQIVGMVI